MRVRVRQTTPQFTIDETFTGATADEVVAAMKRRVVPQLQVLLRMFAASMSPLQFAQEVVRRYNESERKSLPAPQSCAQFLELAQGEGIVTVLEL